jgi:hypothetical protein
MNSERNLTRFLDFEIKDEYGLALDAVFFNLILPNTLTPDPPGTLTGPNTLGSTFWLELFF